MLRMGVDLHIGGPKKQGNQKEDNRYSDYDDMYSSGERSESEERKPKGKKKPLKYIPA